MPEHNRDRRIDAALGLTILGEVYQHELDGLGMCILCSKIVNGNKHTICWSKVPYYSTNIKDTSRIFAKLLDKCQKINITNEDNVWIIRFNDDYVLADSLVEAMWKSVMKLYDLNMEEMIRKV